MNGHRIDLSVVSLVISSILGILAIFAAYDIYFRERETKSLEYIIASPRPLERVYPQFLEGGQTSYEGYEKENVWVYTFIITNTGNQSIHKNDYSEPLILSVDEDFEFIGMASWYENPAVHTDLIELSDYETQIKSVLLNPGDFISGNLIVGGEASPSPLRISGRIAGVSKIETIKAILIFNRFITLAHVIRFIIIIGVGIGVYLLLGKLFDRRLFKRVHETTSNNKTHVSD